MVFVRCVWRRFFCLIRRRSDHGFLYLACRFRVTAFDRLLAGSRNLFSEGVHLGPRIQAWLYDRWSKKYDEGRRESQLRDNEMLAQPLLNALKNVPEPFVLDFATGTERLSYALMSQPDFKGRVIALDISQGMLGQMR